MRNPTSQPDPVPAPVASTSAPAAIAPVAVPRCSCGHDRRHPYVIADLIYVKGSGLKMWLVGASATPREVRYRCRKCGETFDSTTDLTERRRHR